MGLVEALSIGVQDRDRRSRGRVFGTAADFTTELWALMRLPPAERRALVCSAGGAL